MSDDLILEYINTMNHIDFEDFALFLFENAYDNSIARHPTMKNALVRDLHGGSINYKGIYLIHSIPYDLYKNPYDIPVDSPYIVRMLEILYEEYKDQFFPNLNTFSNGRLVNRLQSIYFINNFSGFPMDYYDHYLLDAYEKLINKIGLNFDIDFVTQIGSLDTFINKAYDKTIKLLTEYVNSRSVISINYSGENFHVNQCTFDSNLSAGVGENTKSPYYSLVSKRFSEKNEII